MVKQATIYDTSPEWTPAQREEWMTDALCTQTSPDLWFPNVGQGEKALDARRICHRCPVIAQCAEYALRSDQRFGIWAGMNTTELRRLRSLRRTNDVVQGR